MAYADFTFYTDTYLGDALTEDNADRWLDRASDELDVFTFGRLTDAFPTSAAYVVKVKKAVCAIADALFYIDEQKKAASAQQADDGSYRGAIASITSGKESISYAVGSAASISAYAAAAASAGAQTQLLGDIAAKYLARVPDANGVFLLYAGVMNHGEAGL
jgi:hypothetical protein